MIIVIGVCHAIASLNLMKIVSDLKTANFMGYVLHLRANALQDRIQIVESPRFAWSISIASLPMKNAKRRKMSSEVDFQQMPTIRNLILILFIGPNLLLKW